MAFYRAMEQFLGECLGGRVEATVAPEIDAKIKELTVDVSKLTIEPVKQ